MRTPLVKSINPVLVDPATGRETVVYFGTTVMQDNYSERFKDQNGCVTFVIDVFERIGDDYFVIPGIHPISAKYKRSTYFALFGEMTLNEFEAQKAELMIAQINFNSSQYFGLTSSDLEIVS